MDYPGWFVMFAVYWTLTQIMPRGRSGGDLINLVFKAKKIEVDGKYPRLVKGE